MTRTRGSGLWAWYPPSPLALATICVPGKIRTAQSQEKYTWCRNGLTTPEEWGKRNTDCDVYGTKLTAVALSGHLE